MLRELLCVLSLQVACLGIISGLPRSECAWGVGLCGGEFWGWFIIDSPSDWSSLFCSAEWLFPASMCIVFSSIEAALFVSSRRV